MLLFAPFALVAVRLDYSSITVDIRTYPGHSACIHIEQERGEAALSCLRWRRAFSTGVGGTCWWPMRDPVMDEQGDAWI